VQEIWVPLGAPDAAPFVTQIQPGSVDAVVGAAIWGSDAVRIIRAFEEYGIKGRTPIVVINTAVADGSLLPSLGKTALGLRSYGPYCFGLDTPENKKFVEAFTKHAGKAPGIEAYIGYTAGASRWKLRSRSPVTSRTGPRIWRRCEAWTTSGRPAGSASTRTRTPS